MNSETVALRLLKINIILFNSVTSRLTKPNHCRRVLIQSLDIQAFHVDHNKLSTNYKIYISSLLANTV